MFGLNSICPLSSLSNYKSSIQNWIGQNIWTPCHAGLRFATKVSEPDDLDRHESSIDMFIPCISTNFDLMQKGGDFNPPDVCVW